MSPAGRLQVRPPAIAPLTPGQSATVCFDFKDTSAHASSRWSDARSHSSLVPNTKQLRLLWRLERCHQVTNARARKYSTIVRGIVIPPCRYGSASMRRWQGQRRRDTPCKLREHRRRRHGCGLVGAAAHARLHIMAFKSANAGNHCNFAGQIWPGLAREGLARRYPDGTIVWFRWQGSASHLTDHHESPCIGLSAGNCRLTYVGSAWPSWLCVLSGLTRHVAVHEPLAGRLVAWVDWRYGQRVMPPPVGVTASRDMVKAIQSIQHGLVPRCHVAVPGRVASRC